MLCPRCQSPLVRETLEGVVVDRCGDCRGMWLDEGELGEVLRRTVAPARPEAVAADSDSPPSCPRCGQTMARHQYAHDSGVYLNKCAGCRGFWLTAGQIEQLARYRAATPAVQALETALAADLRSSHRWQRVRELIHSRLLSCIVAGGCLMLIAVVSRNGEAVLRMFRTQLLPLACIWFGDAMGRRWFMNIGGVDTTKNIHNTPGAVVSLVGWLVLFTLYVPVIMALMNG